MSGSGKDLGQGYVNFARNNMDQIRGKVNDELWILTFFEQWYTAQITMMCNWLTERLDHALHFYQCTCLSHILKVYIQIKYKYIYFSLCLRLCFVCRKFTPTLSCRESWRINLTRKHIRRCHNEWLPRRQLAH